VRCIYCGVYALMQAIRASFGWALSAAPIFSLYDFLKRIRVGKNTQLTRCFQ